MAWSVLLGHRLRTQSHGVTAPVSGHPDRHPLMRSFSVMSLFILPFFSSKFSRQTRSLISQKQNSRRAKLNDFFICITRKAEKSCAPPPQRAATEKHRIQGSFPHCHRRRWHCGKRSLNLLDQQWRRGSLESQHHRVEEGAKSATSWRRRRRRRAGLRRQRMRGSAAQWETESESEQAS